jgi:hypothetical protein
MVSRGVALRSGVAVAFHVYGGDMPRLMRSLVLYSYPFSLLFRKVSCLPVGLFVHHLHITKRSSKQLNRLP